MKALTTLHPSQEQASFVGFVSGYLSPDSLCAIFESENSQELFRIAITDSGIIRVYWVNGDDVYAILQQEAGYPRTIWVPLQLSVTAFGWEITREEIRITVNHQGSFQIHTPSGNFELDSFLRQHHSLRCRLSSPASESLFGLGEKVGPLNKKGRFWTQWTTDVAPHEDETDPLYQAIPFALLGQSSEFRGIFLANSARSYVDATDTENLWFGVDDGPLSLYLIPGPQISQVVARYSALTGRMPLMPTFALGFQQSRYSYMTQNEVVEIAKQFRHWHLPLDVIYLDIDYMDGYRIFTFDPVRFSDPKDMISTLDKLGISLVTIVDPGVKNDENYAVYQEGHAHDHFISYLNGQEFLSRVWPGLCAFPDFAKSQTRQWWGQWNARWLALGIKGIWNDMNEPAWWGYTENERACHPDEEVGIVHQTSSGQELPHYLVHNLYALLEAQATFEGLRHASSLRPFILSRSGFSGIQRYAAVWTGDNTSSWEHLALSIPMCLNLGLSGVPMVGPDIGGFLDNATPELFARWIQMGVFFPFARAHTAINTVRHEPWAFGEDVLRIARRYIQYRYRLLPYWYTLMYQAHIDGAPMMRPLCWYDPSDKTRNIDDQFFVGEHFLVAPILREGATHRHVVLPPGLWYDIWNRQWLEGPKEIEVEASLEQLPLFIRQGAIIPLAPRILSTQYWRDTSPWPASLWVLPGHGRFDLYVDDGRTTAYQDGSFSLIQFSVHTTEDSLSVSWQWIRREFHHDTMNQPVILRIGPISGTIHQVSLNNNVVPNSRIHHAILSIPITLSSDGKVDVMFSRSNHH